MKTNDTPILDLMKDIGKGKIQLPDFHVAGCGMITVFAG